MSQEIEYEDSYSPFWPIVIFLAGFLISSIYQIVEISVQRNAINQQYETLAPTVVEAGTVKTRLISFANDLLTTAQKDSAAAQVVREAKDAGIFTAPPPGSTPAPAASSGTGASQ